jgi:hypothetical protein
MTAKHTMYTDPRISTALGELRERIQQRYPDATFVVEEGEDPEGVYLIPTVDAEDTDEVLDVVMDRLLDLQIGEGLPVYVMPALPLARVAEQLAERSLLQRDLLSRIMLQ